MKPLILITNDDGYQSAGIRALVSVAKEFGNVMVMAPSHNASGLAHSVTVSRPLRVNMISKVEGCSVYSCDGTPVDCMKIAQEFYCDRIPDIVLSGINHGSNSSINVLYSGTMGAVKEASLCGFPAVGFSLLSVREDADFNPSLPYVRKIIHWVLENGLPDQVSLNVNIPVPDDGVIRGMMVCRQSKARWKDCYDRRTDPHGRPYFWLSGQFECSDKGVGTDQYALENGYVSVVPTTTDSTDFKYFELFKTVFE